MIRRRLTSAKFALTLVMYLVPLVSFVLAAFVRFFLLVPFYSSDAEPSPYFGLLLLTTVLWAIVVENRDLTLVESLFLKEGRLKRLAIACLITIVAVLAVTFFYRETSFSRIFIWLSAVNLFLLSLLVQRCFVWLWRRGKFSHKARVQLLIVGADDFAVRVANSLLETHVMPCRIAGHIRLPNQVDSVKGCPVYELSDVERLAFRNGFDDVIIAIPASLLANLSSLHVQLAPLGVPMRVVLDIGDGLNTSQRFFHLGGLLMLDLQATSAESLVYIVLKRAFDLAFSFFVLLFTAPLLALIGIGVLLSSPGPMIFAQDRVGLNGRVFRMYKFRTMKVSASEESDLRWTVKGDPRCTRFGKFLRRTGLDEIPQFFNVLKGDMSVVGPRPERPLLVQRFMHSVGEYNTRHYLKVGITGWAQVNGWRGDTSIEKRVEYDLYYVRHWTITFDLLIVFLTFYRGFTDKNAY